MAVETHSLSLFGLVIILSYYSYSISQICACYSSVFGFGDSLTDAGNLIHLEPPGRVPHMYFPPYGETYFAKPTGRCCDGRLILDLIAQHYGLPLPPPSISVRSEGGGDSNHRQRLRAGINFAVVGSRALDASFYQQKDIIDPVTNVSMTDQLNWFKQTLPFLCSSPEDCGEMLDKSLFVVGEFGGNDYTHSLLSGKDKNFVRLFIPTVARQIAQAVHELVEVGAKTVMIPSVLPLGCSASYLTYFPGSNRGDYDELGCLIWANEMASSHNQLLQKELSVIRELHPHANIVYADIYSAAMELYQDPSTFGFSGGALRACCGGGGPYNFNTTAQCGDKGAYSCEDPSSYVNWDGYHLTEAAYRFITDALLVGHYTYPRMHDLCPSNSATLAQI